MHAEIVDLCENFESLCGGQAAASSEIKQYYLASAILDMPHSKQHHYHDLLKDAVFQGQEQSASAGYVTAMTKAHLKDGAVEHSLKYFESELVKMRELKGKREDFLVTIFDSVYGESTSELTYEQYKARYIDSMQMSESLMRESFAVNLLSRVIRDKNYEEVDTLFQLYLVQKHENAILSQLPRELMPTQGVLSEETAAYLSSQEQQDYADIQLRKSALTSVLSRTDVENMVALQELMKGKPVSLFTQVDTRSADELQQLFGIKSKEEIEEILQKTSRFQSAVQSLRDESSAAIEDFHSENHRSYERAFKDNLAAMNNQKREVPDRNVDRAIDFVYNRKRSDPAADYESHKMELDMYNEYMLGEGANNDESDPMYLMEDVHDNTLAGLKEQLLEAINKRKQKVLNVAINIFNKV